MHSIEVSIGNQKYVIRGEESAEHLREVAEIVRRRLEAVRKKNGNLGLQKAAMLAAFDLASDLIKKKKVVTDYRAAVVAKAQSLIQRMETELDSRS